MYSYFHYSDGFLTRLRSAQAQVISVCSEPYRTCSSKMDTHEHVGREVKYRHICAACLARWSTCQYGDKVVR
jgi:hypothetical protein